MTVFSKLRKAIHSPILMITQAGMKRVGYVDDKFSSERVEAKTVADTVPISKQANDSLLSRTVI
jgi:hypothetical protein